ncbi:PD40 domain-containing protein [Desulfovibrio sp. JC022]|uniref:PD40 domain-containing protein n=1 Tax=Desulfovibrio sp. JC022 TaxID=2593642 RepID=UPI0013D43C6A|nr:PD40 domain-containing protein [Desulfovibrio sp. JC022]NDV21890.1 protein tolB [Desulfovibrio sp. JC022]
MKKNKLSIKKSALGLLVVMLLMLLAVGNLFAADTLTVDIYGPGQRKVNIILLPPKTVPEGKYKGSKDKDLPLPAEAGTFNKDLTKDLGFLPFLNIVPITDILGGDPSRGVRPGDIDIKPLRLSKVDLALTAGWEIRPNGEKNLLLRCIGTFNGRTILGKKYSMVTEEMLPRIADRFCSHLMRILTGRDGFFESSIAFVRKQGKNKEIYTVSPQGRNLRQISSLGGINLSPNWSPDGNRLVFTRLGSRQHLLCVWDRATGKIDQKSFPGNTVIGPEFLPDGNMAATLTMNGNSDIFLINGNYKPKKALAKSWAIEVSPDFDRTGQKMVFTSARFGNPHIFLLDMNSGVVTRVTTEGKYNTNPTISPDGRYVAFSRQTPLGHRIFVHDLKSGGERQLTFGPGNDEDPAFGPDGYFIAFSSSRNGKYKIYLTTRHGDPAMLVPTGNGVAKAPAWGKAHKS